MEIAEKIEVIARTSNGFSVKFIRNLASLALIIIGVLLWWFDIPELLRTFSDSNAQSLIWILVISSVCYCLLLMLPFVPGVELGFLS
jgi:glucose uptake protein GlcU